GPRRGIDGGIVFPPHQRAHILEFTSFDVFDWNIRRTRWVPDGFDAAYPEARFAEQVAKLLFGQHVPIKALGRFSPIADQPLIENPREAAQAVQRLERAPVQISDYQRAASPEDAMHFLERLAGFGEMDDQAHERCIEGAIRKRSAL